MTGVEQLTDDMESRFDGFLAAQHFDSTFPSSQLFRCCLSGDSLMFPVGIAHAQAVKSLSLGSEQSRVYCLKPVV